MRKSTRTHQVPLEDLLDECITLIDNKFYFVSCKEKPELTLEERRKARIVNFDT